MHLLRAEHKNTPGQSRLCRLASQPTQGYDHYEAEDDKRPGGVDSESQGKPNASTNETEVVRPKATYQPAPIPGLVGSRGWTEMSSAAIVIYYRQLSRVS
jgi:hypothetical protein